MGGETSNYQRIIIVDSQLKNKKGHNYRYAQGIAHEFDLPTIVLSHHEFKGGKDGNINIHPCLSFDQYNNGAFKDSFKSGLIEKLGRYKDFIIKRAVQPNGVWKQDSPLGQTIKFSIVVLKVLLFFPELLYQLTLLLVGRGSSAHKDTTALELKAAFKSIHLKKGDLLVFQTMMWPTFESLLELNIHTKSYDCDAVFIIHEDWLIYGIGFMRFVPSKFKKRVLEALPFTRSKVLATNARLSEFCQEWCEYRPDVVKEVSFPIENLAAPTNANSSTKRILIPGPYRGDKNFESIGLLIEAISDRHPSIEYCMHRSVSARVAIPFSDGDHIITYSDIDGAEQWLAFISSFDIILLPYGDTYKHRISGIIHEARLLNVPVICSKDIADASLITNPLCLFGEQIRGVAEAVEICLNIDRSQPFFQIEHPPGIGELVIRHDGWVERQNKPIAVQVKPAWTRCGTTVVLDAQLDYLIERGYFVIEIYLKTEPWAPTPSLVDFMWQIMRGGREFSGGMVARILFKDVTLLPFCNYVIKLLRRRIPAFFKRENIHGTWCKPDAALSHFLQKNKADIVLVNHIFNSDFAYKYIPGKKYICETHDIQINQLLLRRPELKNNYYNELKYELGLLAQYDAVVNLNKTEHNLIASSIGKTAHYIRPAITPRKQNTQYDTLLKLIKEQSSYGYINHLPKKFDLLIIGDGHPANIESTQQFIDHVYPKLPKGTTLGLVGTVCNHIKINWDNNNFIDIHTIGFLDQLCNLYDFTNLLILPDVVGEGIPIKTDEAIANKIPFIATPHALRGFSSNELDAVGIHAAENEAGIISDIIDMLQSSRLRADMCEKSQQLLESHSLEKYYAEWDVVIHEEGI